MTELRCQSPTCDGFVTRQPAGKVLEFVRVVRHSSRAAPENLVIPCSECGKVHEVRIRALAA